ncbi:hypothetical protein SPHINGO8BC_51657 [Sphingobacterium multivorum]|uniref:Uncharacterized protein n=1 Tax=Sphingobacterium multivorum TaxID=28454 RepID=A0A654D8S9_SPHMU|nr:hypothetical protein SPHINGO8BC_51657 [Sphingobacterium multivorum]
MHITWKSYLNKKQNNRRLSLQNGANTEKVYQNESDVLSAFQLAERTKSKKIMKLFQ